MRIKWERISIWVKTPSSIMHIVEQITKYHPDSQGKVWKMVEKGGRFAVYTKKSRQDIEEEAAKFREIKEEMLDYL